MVNRDSNTEDLADVLERAIVSLFTRMNCTRAIYLRPSLISNALHGGCLPFVPNVVTGCAKLRYAVEGMLSLPEDDDEDLEASTKLVGLADVLLELSGQSLAGRGGLNVATINRIKESRSNLNLTRQAGL